MHCCSEQLDVTNTSLHWSMWQETKQTVAQLPHIFQSQPEIIGSVACIMYITTKTAVTVQCNAGVVPVSPVTQSVGWSAVHLRSRVTPNNSSEEHGGLL